MKTIIVLFTVFVNCVAFASSTGMFLKLSAPNIPDAKLLIFDQRCIGNPIKETLFPKDPEEYIQSDDSPWVWDSCFGTKVEDKWIRVGLYVGAQKLREFKFYLKNLDPWSTESVHESGYQIVTVHYPNYGVGSQNRIEIRIARSPEMTINWDAPLNKQLFVGVHDAGSYSINSSSFPTPDTDVDIIALGQQYFGSLVAGWAKTQDLSIKGQLDAGARYLDLRLCGARYGEPRGSLNEVYTCHSASGAKIKDIFNDIKIFVDNNPTALIIIDINSWNNLSNNQIDGVMTSFRSMFGNKIAESSEFNPTTLMKNFRKLGKQVILIVRDGNPVEYENLLKIIEAYQPIYWNASTVETMWSNTTDTTKLLSDLTQTLNKNPNEMLQVFGMTLTPNTNTILNGLILIAPYPRNLKDFSGTYAFNLSKWVYDNKKALEMHGGILSGDFIAGEW